MESHKVIIAGSRELAVSPYFIEDVLHQAMYSPDEQHALLHYFTHLGEVVCGKARGVDTSGDDYAYMRRVPVKYFPAEWDKHGKSAGAIRNKQMAEYADTLVLIWDGKSKGSANMKQTMEKLGKPVYEVVFKGWTGTSG